MDAIGSTFGAAIKHVHELFTLQQLDREIARWLDEEYHLREHSETGRAPAEYWSQSVRLKLPGSEDDLNLLLLKYDRECAGVPLWIGPALAEVCDPLYARARERFDRLPCGRKNF